MLLSWFFFWLFINKFDIVFKEWNFLLSNWYFLIFYFNIKLVNVVIFIFLYIYVLNSVIFYGIKNWILFLLVLNKGMILSWVCNI